MVESAVCCAAAARACSCSESFLIKSAAWCSIAKRVKLTCSCSLESFPIKLSACSLSKVSVRCAWMRCSYPSHNSNATIPAAQTIFAIGQANVFMDRGCDASLMLTSLF